jgi:hypothetical protein
MNPATHLPRQARAATKNGDHKWSSSAMDIRERRERGQGRNLKSTYA